MKKYDELTKIYCENIVDTTDWSIADELYRLLTSLRPGTKTKSGGLVSEELESIMKALEEITTAIEQNPRMALHYVNQLKLH